MDIPFVGQAYAGRSSEVDSQELVNLFLDVDPAGGKSTAALYGTPGQVLFAELMPGRAVRGACTGNGFLYAVCGSGFYSVNSSGDVTYIGAVSDSDSLVSMRGNGFQMVIADGSRAWMYTYESKDFAELTSEAFPGAGVVDYLDGYFIFNEPGSSRFFITGLYDGSSLDPLDFASAESSPDGLVSLIVDHRELYLMGETTVETWYNSGAATFPFDRNANAQVEIGIAAPRSVVAMDNTIIWLTNKGTVVRMSGYTPQIISTRAIEYQISKEDISSGIAMTYTQEGHNFYVLTFPGGKTWVYDAASSGWHQRKSFGSIRWRPNCCVAFAGKNIVGDCSTGRLYELSMDALTDDGMPIERVRTTAPIKAGGKLCFMSELEIDFEGGVGTLTGQGANPQACLQWSDDGGRTWSNERWSAIGRQGVYGQRALWRRLGSFRQRCFRVTITDPVRVVIIAAFGDIEVGTE